MDLEPQRHASTLTIVFPPPSPACETSLVEQVLTPKGSERGPGGEAVVVVSPKLPTKLGQTPH